MHKLVNFASLADSFIVSFSKLLKLWSWSKRGKHKQLFGLYRDFPETGPRSKHIFISLLLTSHTSLINWLPISRCRSTVTTMAFGSFMDSIASLLHCVRRSPKVSGGMLKTDYESNACLLLETDLRWLLWRLGLLRRALKSGLWPVMNGNSLG